MEKIMQMIKIIGSEINNWQNDEWQAMAITCMAW